MRLNNYGDNLKLQSDRFSRGLHTLLQLKPKLSGPRDRRTWHFRIGTLEWQKPLTRLLSPSSEKNTQHRNLNKYRDVSRILPRRERCSSFYRHNSRPTCMGL